MKVSSAPGAAFLFGEHAVVYGEPAVLAAVDQRVCVSAEPSDGEDVYVTEVEDDSYVELAVELVRESLDEENVTDTYDDVGFSDGVELTVDTGLPVGAGLGSSAAVSVATLDAVSRLYGVERDANWLVENGREVERRVQGEASISDSATAVHGGLVAVNFDGKDSCTGLEPWRLNFSPTLVVACDGGRAPTGEMVSGVEDLVESYGSVGKVVDAIGEVSREGMAMIEDGEIEEVAELMNVNHGLLSALGVTSRSLDRLVYEARETGALGAKMTGAGGSGSIIALTRDPEDAEGLEFDSAELVFTSTLSNGLRRLE
ncbi:MAG: mevalonate kinase [Halobacteria archaeon]